MAVQTNKTVFFMLASSIEVDIIHILFYIYNFLYTNNFVVLLQMEVFSLINYYTELGYHFLLLEFKLNLPYSENSPIVVIKQQKRISC
ncbi:hypothetical protein GCM10017161_32940 [Thalassotalea marina]|uniref:Uncharacterized protein n=1 Tax=Thalassotalea marina TaxID=1673741 RepID=A0A919BN72_9GAMM|nr:hypothetical protein GCM10017161_32940 [Thalassotalea marina]